MKYILLIFFTLPFVLSGQSNTEEYNWPSLSPLQTITQEIGTTSLKISYERPSKRGRKIYGGLVPWDKVWRTGAGHCTKLSFDKPLFIHDQMVQPGTYSIFTIPNPDEWTVILNTDTTLYGSGFYTAEKDVLRFKVKPMKTRRVYEALTIDIDFIPNNARIYVSWDQVQIGFDVKTSTDDDIEKYIDEELMTFRNKNADTYGMACDHYFFKNENLEKALKLADMSLELDASSTWMYRMKTEIFEKLGRYPEAIKEIDRAILLVEKKDYDAETKASSLKFWDELRMRIEKQM